MNLIVLHGDDYLKVKKRLDSFVSAAKRRGWLIEYIGVGSAFDLAEAVSAGSLFTKDKLVVVEDARRVTLSQLKWLSANQTKFSTTLVFISDGFLSQLILSKLPKKAKIESFRLPKAIFDFLDSLYPKNATQAISLFKTVLKTEPVERVFAMISRHFRDMYWARHNAASLPYPQKWRVGKISVQARRFKNGQLKNLISQAAEADIKAKTSTGSLVDSLDQIILTQLE